ncbi:KTSC domain-containing protein [Polaromonas sp.]|uniref:KTSC domain-containing protein n=1 Tax=Polaromonas sp. TaxID=1869339 RepID=UPI002FCA1960
MDWINTPESSSIARFAFDDASRVLKVEFKNGNVYDYFDIPDHVFDGMRAAPSKGQYLAQYVKGNYRYARA